MPKLKDDLSNYINEARPTPKDAAKLAFGGKEPPWFPPADDFGGGGDDDEDEGENSDNGGLRPWIAEILSDIELLVEVPQETKDFCQMVMSSLEWPTSHNPGVVLSETPWGQVMISLLDPVDPKKFRKRVDLIFDCNSPRLQFTRWAGNLKGDTLGTTTRHTLIAQKLVIWLFSPEPPIGILV